jgi:hypothetical protein
MRDDHIAIAGLTAVVLLGALAVGAAGPDTSVNNVTDQEAPQTAVFIPSERQAVPSESVEPTPAYDSKVLSAKAIIGCSGIVVRATELVFSDSFETGDTDSWGPEALARFSASRILDLEFAVRFTEGLAGDHVLRLKLLTPKGHHYQTLSVPITSSAKRQGSRRRVDGYPRPLAVRMVHKAGISSLPEVNLSVPVGGTPIVTSSIHGTWTAEAYLDDDGEACASQPFVLTP